MKRKTMRMKRKKKMEVKRMKTIMQGTQRKGKVIARRRMRVPKGAKIITIKLLQLAISSSQKNAKKYLRI